MLYLLRTKTKRLRRLSFAFIFLLVGLSAFSQKQLFQEEHDYKPYYFGITLSTNLARFQTHLHPYFLQQDTVLVAEPVNSGGFALGLSATARLTNRFELRFNPQLAFMDRSIQYKMNYPDGELGTDITKKVESVTVTFPLQLKFNSDRIGNFRVYMLGGGKMDFDLASNARARKAEELVKIQKLDYGVEAGLGFNFYFQSFIFSPEIKISNGLNNIHSRDEMLKYSNVLDRIQSRMIVFSIHLEG
ncbi:MAG TPA: outer membrane beta-barrel protein [Chitinophagaceae bacterium]|jgi:hypothetical protein|nr:outer membrane beta-barrel protein [Chitinophagaceae bacterium]